MWKIVCLVRACVVVFPFPSYSTVYCIGIEDPVLWQAAASVSLSCIQFRFWLFMCLFLQFFDGGCANHRCSVVYIGHVPTKLLCNLDLLYRL
jgi:hypothetical protein